MTSEKIIEAKWQNLHSFSHEMNESGFAVLRNIVPKSFLNKVGHHITEVEARFGSAPDTWNSWLFEGDATWLAIIHSNFVRLLARHVIGADALHLSSHYWVKRARSVAIVPWHQDAAFFKLRGGKLVTAWIPLDKATNESGCLAAVVGSHKQKILPLVPTSGGQLLRRAATGPQVGIVENIEAYRGDVVLLHGAVLHMSGQNQTSRPRRALSIRMLPYGTEIVEPRAWPHLTSLG